MPAKLIVTLEKFDSQLWAFHFPIPGDVAAQFIDGDNRRIICSMLGHDMQCALMGAGDGDWFVNVNKKVRDKLGLIEGQQVEVEITKDESEFGMPMPDELRELLVQDDKGNEHFLNLTPGKQRNLIYIVNNVKNPDIKLRRALCIVEHLKMQNGKIDFKALHAEIKAANQAAKRL